MISSTKSAKLKAGFSSSVDSISTIFIEGKVTSSVFYRIITREPSSTESLSQDSKMVAGPAFMEILQRKKKSES